ncbi:hypothetical protein EER27_09440 [Lysobacter psychrotolerans]|uniref:Uncharacterized protein n=1 Tax=Montanilutibacter psychrotolerans TaxID=1327343 RepID=A0A3M8SSC9_9GAMM|nr:hypothetical protein EER27_09440 [Lysobacter psychrotolerans]
MIEQLRSQPKNTDFSALETVTSRETCFIDQGGIAHIGAWALRVRDGKAVLVRSGPRAPVMMVPIAYLTYVDGRWDVTEIDLSTVRGR